MMDYKELIESLNGYFEGKELKRGDALKAATAIEALLAENEVAMKALHGECRHCKYNEPLPHSLGKRNECISCVHDGDEQYRCMMMGKIFVSEGRRDNWEWSHKPTDRMPLPEPPCFPKERGDTP